MNSKNTVTISQPPSIRALIPQNELEENYFHIDIVNVTVSYYSCVNKHLCSQHFVHMNKQHCQIHLPK